MSSLFKGLGEFANKGSSQYGTRAQSSEVYIAQVLGVIKESTEVDGSKAVDTTPTAVGAIRINRINQPIVPENQVSNIAEPLDRNHYRLPMAGEQVLVTQQNGKYYYFAVVTSLANLLVNIDPGLMLNSAQSSGTNAFLIDTDLERKRFKSRLDISSTLFDSKTQLPSRVREGDTILEGRMGGIIKLTQTITKEGIWNKEKQVTNVGTTYDGDPMLIMKSNIRKKSFDDLDIVNGPMEGLEDDDINGENSSVYLTTTQNIPIQLASSKKFFSWTANIVTADSSIMVDPETAVLSSLIPDAYDPNDEVQVIVGGIVHGTGAGTGGGNGAALGLPESEALAYDLILSHEGTILEAMWDIANWRIGHGSSTFTLQDNSIVKLPGDPTKWPTGFDPVTKTLSFTDIGNEATTRGTKLSNGWMWKSKQSGRPSMNLISELDADRDLARRVRDEFLPGTKQGVVAAARSAGKDGEAIWSAMGKGGHAALCSIKYNYGNVTQNGAAKAAVNVNGDPNLLANWIENSLQGGSKDRHRDEAFTCRTGTVR